MAGRGRKVPPGNSVLVSGDTSTYLGGYSVCDHDSMRSRGFVSWLRQISLCDM